MNSFLPIVSVGINEKDAYTELCRYSVDTLSPSPRPFASPYKNSKDANALNCVITNENGCSLSENAVRFAFDPNSKMAILSINKSKIEFDNGSEFANVVCSLSGNYGFSRKVYIKIVKERADCVSIIVPPIYFNKGETKTLEVNISTSMDLPCLFVSCQGIEKALNDLVSGGDYYIDFPEVAISGNIDIQTEQYEVKASSDWTVPVSKSVPIFINPIEWVDNDGVNIEPNGIDAVLYKNGECQHEIIQLINRGNETFPNVIVETSDANCVRISPNSQFSLLPQNPFPINIEIVPSESVGSKKVVLSAKHECGFVSNCIINVETKAQIPPTIKMSFVPNKDEGDDNVVYYIGQGVSNVGKLIVNCIKSDNKTREDGYASIDLTNIKPKCKELLDSLCFELSKQYKEIRSLTVGDKVEYNVQLNLSEMPKEEGEISVFTILMMDASEEIRVSVSHQMETLEIKEERHYSPDYSQGNKSYKMYDISLKYYPFKENDYSKRKHKAGKLVLSGDEQLSFGDQVIEREKAIDDTLLLNNHFSIYYISPKEWSQKENLDDDLNLQGIKIQYIEEGEGDIVEKTLKKAGIKKIDTSPLLEVYYLDENRKERTIYSEQQSGDVSEDVFSEAPIYRYDPNNNLGVEHDVCFSLWFRNKQMVKEPLGCLKLENISIESKPKDILAINGNSICININNGERDFEFPILINMRNLITRGCEKITGILKFMYNDLSKEIKFTIPVEKEIPDVWYSLDMGTSSIVVACSENNADPSIVKLHDQENVNRIEKEDEVLSSIAIVKEKSGEPREGELVLAPSKMDLYSNIRLIPGKFLAGRNELPMIETYRQKFPEGIQLEEHEEWDEIKPNDIIEYIYKDVFNRMPEGSSENVYNLVITYPNTYTPLLIETLCDTIIQKNIFPNLKPQNLYTIPESDAVVAYYVNECIINGEGLGDEESQTIVIYDMGAGTLDLSLAKLEKKGDKLDICIEKRIGVPIGGAYISEVIYDFLESEQYFATIPDNATDELKKQKLNLRRDFVENLKRDWGKKEYNGDEEAVLAKGKTINVDTFNASNELNNVLSLCTNDIFEYLIGTKEWKDSIDKVVFSGRGSRFVPIREKIKGIIGQEKQLSVEQLKTCVAIGAIQYQRIIKDDNSSFLISHLNTHQNIGLAYYKLNNNFNKERTYTQIINSADVHFEEYANASFAYVDGENKEPIDLSFKQNATLYLTPFDEKDMLDVLKDSKDVRSCLVTHLMTFKTQNLRTPNSVTIHITTDVNGRMNIKFNDNQQLGERQLADNIENNKYYKHYFEIN